MRAAVKQHARDPFRSDVFESLAAGVRYVATEFDDDSGEDKVGDTLEELDRTRGTGGNRLHYLAVPPVAFPIVVREIGEVRLVAETLPQATQCFMHPVKAEEAIAEAYFDYGVKTFSLDTMEELEKIVRATKVQLDVWKDLAWATTIRMAREWLTIHAGSTEVAEGLDAFEHKRPVDYEELRS